MAKGKFLKKKRFPVNGMTVILLLLLIGLGSLLLWKCCSPEPSGSTTLPGSTVDQGTVAPTETEGTTASTTEATTAPTEPHPISTATMGVTGDMLIHSPMLTAAKQADGTYDFSSFYKYISQNYRAVDFMIANLEVTLGGEAAGSYSGYPTFNCPDSLVDALKDAGVDMMLTANNHAYDTGHDGFLRTQQVLEEKGMLHLGTRTSEEAKTYLVQDINGVKVGMACYTYESKRSEAGTKYLNGIKIGNDDRSLLNSFSYDYLTEFYNEIETTLADMEMEGADVTMLFLHWGNEYQRTPSSFQKKMSEKLCELGVDFIIGAHPHVVQPFTVLSSADGNHKTYCLYSMGNAVSNQRRESLSTVENAKYTEDGMVFQIGFEKWSDGTVRLSMIDVLPTWVDRAKSGDSRIYTIVPLDPDVDWTTYELGTHNRLQPSYDQTMKLITEGLTQAQESVGSILNN